MGLKNCKIVLKDDNDAVIATWQNWEDITSENWHKYQKECVMDFLKKYLVILDYDYHSMNYDEYQSMKINKEEPNEEKE